MQTARYWFYLRPKDVNSLTEPFRRKYTAGRDHSETLNGYDVTCRNNEHKFQDVANSVDADRWFAVWKIIGNKRSEVRC